MSETSKKVALRFIEAMGAGDSDAFAAATAPDSFIIAKGSAQLSGRREHDAMIVHVDTYFYAKLAGEVMWPQVVGFRPS